MIEETDTDSILLTRSPEDQALIDAVLLKHPTAVIGKIGVWRVDKSSWGQRWDDEPDRNNNFSHLPDGEEYAVLRYLADNDDDWTDSDYASAYNASPNFRGAIAEAKYDAWLAGCTHVIIHIDIGVVASRTVCHLYSSPTRIKRRAEAEADKKRKAEAEEQRRIDAARRMERLERFATSVCRSITPHKIIRFYRAWASCTGYGPDRDAQLRLALGPCKHRLIQSVLDRARESGWEYGSRRDPFAHNAYKDVLYIDTPEGQVSFHIIPGSYGELPPYAKPWSEVHNTDSILARVYDSAQQCAA